MALFTPSSRGAAAPMSPALRADTIDGRGKRHRSGRAERQALAQLTGPRQIVLVPGATHLFEEQGALDEVGAMDAPLVGTYGEVRTVLSFKVADTALQKFVPPGWQLSPPIAGPSKGANLVLVLIDW